MQSPLHLPRILPSSLGVDMKDHTLTVPRYVIKFGSFPRKMPVNLVILLVSNWHTCGGRSHSCQVPLDLFAAMIF